MDSIRGLDRRTVAVLPDTAHYWKVVVIATGDALMCGWDSPAALERWAQAKGYQVLNGVLPLEGARRP